MAKSRNGNGSKEREKPDPPVWSRRIWSGSGNIEVAVWSRMVGSGDEEREVLNTTIRKTFKDGDEYKDSRTLFPEDVGIAVLLLQQAFAYVTDATNKQ